ncbi:hypothetical protein PoB_002025200 [Plakobranchus ocellatus]|uniref:Uncharacterized protein n=1 Tax=Plakobranchus ocellatus TaxID=259542 RepID=A0AAV3ZGX2_9GAST|nr:hypothetical protein PoB_002025200 [Plakobranchus ocellatus]
MSDDRTQKFNEARRAGGCNGVLDCCDAVQLFRVHAGHSQLWSDMLRRKWSSTTVSSLCGEQTEDCSHVLFSCGELDGIRGPTGATLRYRRSYGAVWIIR